MNSIETFETERIRAGRLRDRDFDNLLRMNQDSRVRATLGGVQTEEQTKEFLRRELERWDRYGYGVWILTSKATGEFAGRAFLRNTHVAGKDEIELGYALMAQFWGKGLATEVSRAILRIAFEHLAVPSVVAFTLPTNRASQRVMEKLGMKFEGNITWADLPHVLYRITRADWHRASTNRSS